MSWERDMQALDDILAGANRDKYQAWIAEHVQDGYGKCKEITRQMADAFPELTRVRGHFYDWAWGERAHWWLTDPNGNIVDPTADQFPSKGKGEYVPWEEGAPEPTGKCPNCCDPCYDGQTFCSENCAQEYVAYCNARI